jgi:hypothetical protein
MFGQVWAGLGRMRWVTRGPPRTMADHRGHTRALNSIGLRTKFVGAGDGDRTRMTSLEGWSSTIELHPHVSLGLQRV